MMNKKIVTMLLGTVLMLMLLTGCSPRTLDELYTLPKQSAAYYDLQESIDQIMSSGAVYSGPAAGANQQPVQLVDLDGDGTDEAIVFLKASGDHPLKVYVFAGRDDHYENVAVVEGEGSGFDVVEYAQLDGEPGMEMILGRQLSGQVAQTVSAYTYRDAQMIEVMNCIYSEFKVVDLDGDAKKDVFVLQTETEKGVGVAQLYRWQDGRMKQEHEASMSVGAKQVKRIITGYLEEHIQAVFVASAYEEDAIITDIFAFADSAFENVAIADQREVSAQTVRSHNVYATDIDGDGIIELPMLQVLPSYVTGTETQWVIDWYSLTPTGGQKAKMTTYHNFVDGWYLELPRHWRDQITVDTNSASPNMTAHTVSKWLDYDTEPQEIFTVYAITGKNRTEQAQADGKFLIAEKGETVYAGSFGSCDWAKSLSQQELTAMFRFIYVDWNWGET